MWKYRSTIILGVMLLCILAVWKFFPSPVAVYIQERLPEYAVPMTSISLSSPPLQYSGQILPTLTGSAYILGEAKRGQILLAKEEQRKLAIGSITKLMTAVVAREYMRDISEILISKEAAQVEGAQIGVLEGEKYRKDEILKAMLIRSGNDGALALAENFPTGSGSFIMQMNKKAQDLGMTNTHFSNPMGFDDPANYATAQDVFTLASYIVRAHPEIIAMTEEKQMIITSITGTSYLVKSTNQLLESSFLPIKGMKTGTTEEAGASFVGYAQYPDRDMIAVVLNSADRFQDAKTLFWWASEYLH